MRLCCVNCDHSMSLSCQESILRATRYLPELVQLQKHMFDFSHRRLDRKEAAKLPVRDYVQSLPGKQLHTMLIATILC